MGKYNQDIVEMTKLINRSPIDSFWIYCEMDLTFNVVGTTNKVTVRTDDRILSYSEAFLLSGSVSNPIPVGTYAIGTFSTPTTNCPVIPPDEFNRFILVVATQGYVFEVLNFTTSMDKFREVNIPNFTEEGVDWIAEENDLRPIIKTIANGGYAIGASYSSLELRGPF